MNEMRLVTEAAKDIGCGWKPNVFPASRAFAHRYAVMLFEIADHSIAAHAISLADVPES